MNLIIQSSKYFLHGHGPIRAQKSLLKIVDAMDPQSDKDSYGAGDQLLRFEEKVAKLLGKEAGVFMPSGTMAQQIALRIWADRSGRRHVAMHPTCHVLIHEEAGFVHLHNLSELVAGDASRTLTAKDFEPFGNRAGSAVIELPQRYNGGSLPSFEELLRINAWARSHHVKLQLDGARLWETQCFYQKPLAEITALFDSVYVSFYKGLGGIGGAMLLGTSDYIAEARVWLRRHGGNLIHLFPFSLAAEQGFNRYLPRMPLYFERAQLVAKLIATCKEMSVSPQTLHTNMMHVYFRVKADFISKAASEVSEKTGVWLLAAPWKHSFSEEPVWELYIGEGALNMDPELIASALHLFDEKLAFYS